MMPTKYPQKRRSIPTKTECGGRAAALVERGMHKQKQEGDNDPKTQKGKAPEGNPSRAFLEN